MTNNQRAPWREANPHPSEHFKIWSLGFPNRGEVGLVDYEEGPLGQGQFRLATLYTGLSAGTELTFYKGTNPYLHSHWDDVLGLFKSEAASTEFPVSFVGYMEVGRCVASRTPAVQEGDVVAMMYGHKTGHTANAFWDFFRVLPRDMDPLLGIYVTQMGPICANGILHADADVLGPLVPALGAGIRDKHVLIMGGGVVGLLTGLFAKTLGAREVAVADATPERLQAAEGLGLLPINTGETPAWRWCKSRWHDGERGADIVFQCRAQDSALHESLQSLRPQGTVIDLSFYQGGMANLRLGEEFHHNGLRIVCAQINRVPRGLAHEWHKGRLADATLDLLRSHGAAIREHVVTDVIPLEDAGPLITALAERRRHVLQAVFAVNE